MGAPLGLGLRYNMVRLGLGLNVFNISHKINITLFLPIEICICHVGILQLEINNISAVHVGRMHKLVLG